MNIRNFALIAGIALTVTSNASMGAPLYSGVITGTFDSPVFTGETIELDGVTRRFRDNTGSAVFSGVGTNTFSTGTGTSTTGITETTLSFVGAAFTDVRPFLPGAPGDVFELGTLSYTNGRSSFDTVVFGITLNLTGDLGPLVILTPEAIEFGIIQTAGDATTTPEQNADFLTISVIGKTFHTFEDETASVVLTGKIVGDPVLEFVDIELPPGGTNGFIRSITTVPEPTTFALLTAMLTVFGYSTRRRPD